MVWFGMNRDKMHTPPDISEHTSCVDQALQAYYTVFTHYSITTHLSCMYMSVTDSDVAFQHVHGLYSNWEPPSIIKFTTARKQKL